MSETEEFAELVTQLERTPPGFRKRLTLVLRQALEDEDDGEIEMTANISGPPGARYIRQWEAMFRTKSRVLGGPKKS